MQQQSQTIKKDTMISDILAHNPEKATLLSEILMEFGIHCVGCGAASYETLEAGVLSHGFTQENLNKLVDDLNKAVLSPSNKPKKEIIDFSLKLTEPAIKKVKQIIESEGKEKQTLRVSVLTGGCSGYTYDLEITDSAPKEDLKFKQEDLEISVDKNSLEYLNGTKIDFLDSLKESGFKFLNPNATKECGCGKSFS